MQRQQQTRITMNNMSNEAYHADTARIGKSGLDLINKSPAHYYAKYLDPFREKEKQTPALLMGSAVHAAILEPTKFVELFAIEPEVNRRTNEGKDIVAAFELANKGKTVITAEMFREANKLKDAVRKHPAAQALLESGVAETVLTWRNNEFGVGCKAKPDFLSSTGFIVDVKTTEDAGPNDFGKSVINFRYDVQAAWYIDGYKQVYGEYPRGFAFIAVEKKPPYAVAVYYVPNPIFDMGRRKYLQNLATYAECLHSNTWPAYSNEIVELTLPAWAK